VNLNAGRARPPHVRPATGHPKAWVENRNSKFKMERESIIGNTAVSEVGRPLQLFLESRFPRHTWSGLGYWSTWPAPIHALTGHILQLRIRKVPWRRGSFFRGNERTDELGPVSNAAHECSFHKRIEKRGNSA
jgi:hypothetical protein